MSRLSRFVDRLLGLDGYGDYQVPQRQHLVRLAPGEYWLPRSTFAMLYPKEYLALKDALPSIGKVELPDGTIVHLVEPKL